MLMDFVISTIGGKIGNFFVPAQFVPKQPKVPVGKVSMFQGLAQKEVPTVYPVSGVLLILGW